jgi:quercetin dioxygenase-like cupin family protein
VVREEMTGMPGEEVVVQYVELKPGAAIPWHMHPDGHEISVIVEGSETLEVEGQPPRKIGVGEGFHIQPNVVHRGSNDSNAPAKIVTVRIKPKDKPIMCRCSARSFSQAPAKYNKNGGRETGPQLHRQVDSSDC